MAQSPAISAVAQTCRLYLDAYASWVHGFKPAWHHKVWLDKIQAVVEGRTKKRKLLILGPPGHGKALALDTPIPTPAGWTTMGEIQPGDELFDEAGRVCRVVAKTPVWKDRPVYSVTTDDGDSIIADAAHEWMACTDRKGGAWRIRTTEDLARKRSKRPMIPIHWDLELPKKQLPIDPYILGIWLGDGSSRSGEITVGDEDRAHVIREIEEAGYTVVPRAAKYAIGIKELGPLLREIGLISKGGREKRYFGQPNKHIPAEYLRASSRQRFYLLQGLIDSDGHVAQDGQVEFGSTNKRIADGVLELVRSLGRKASMCEGRAKLNGKDCGPVYRVLFYMENAARLERKRERCRNAIRTPNRYLTVEPAGTADTVCIQVDSPSHLFLAGRGMVVTHNSVYVSTVLPLWYLGNHPDHYVMHFTSSDDNAYAQLNTIKLGLDANERHTIVFPDDKCRPNKDRGWSQVGLYLNGTPESERHAGYRGLGMTTAFVGARAHGVIIDDPMSSEDARSETEQKKVKSKYAEEIVPRLIPETGWVIAIATRWHEKDLPGYWIEMMEKDEEDWDVLALPAIAEDGVDYGGPVPGVYPHGDRALWPERFPMPFLEAERKRLGVPAFLCQYQHNPTAIGGDIFRNPEWFQHLPLDFDVPGRSGQRFRDTLTLVQFWDLAFSSKTSADWTVAVTLGKDREGRLYWLDMWRGRVAELADKTEDDERGLSAQVSAHIARVRPAVVGVENNAYQHGVTRSLISRVNKLLIKKDVACVVKGVKVDTDKVTRAQLPADIAEAGDLFVDRRAHWWPPALKEIMGFPNASNDDIVDALAGACRLAREGIVGNTGETQKNGTYAMKAAEDPPGAGGFNPFDVLEQQYATTDRERITRVLARTRGRRYPEPSQDTHAVPN